MPQSSQLLEEIPGLAYLKQRGYEEISQEGIVIEGWPVQFLPVSSALTSEAYLNASIIEVGGTPVRVVLAEHLVAIMLDVGRPKDTARIEMFISQQAVDESLLMDIISRHSLTEKWNSFQQRKF